MSSDFDSPASVSGSAPAPRAARLPFFKPGWMKKGVNLSKGVQKFVQYNKDLMSPSKLAAVEVLHARYQAALGARDQAAAEILEKELVQSCEGAVPEYKSSVLKENVEVIVVAIVVALGIRAYFLQPFKIPTASMQPTLNGITAKAMPDGEAFPNYVVRGLEFAARGRNYVEMRVPSDWGTVQLVGIRQRSTLHFFTVTDLIFVDSARQQKVLTGYVPARQMWESLWIGEKPYVPNSNILQSGPESFELNVGGKALYQGGALVVRGRIDTGDQVLVNKMAYHFRRPDRGEVFVFSTAGIKGIVPPEGIDSQHYIKRLTGVPGDKLQLLPDEERASIIHQTGQAAKLYINGAVAAEPGMQRVMAAQGDYAGYTSMDGPLRGSATGFFSANGVPKNFMSGPEPVMLQAQQYMAMGDNSPQSSDSRVWGPVKEENLIGPALLVYWPFLPHFGLIR